MAERWIDDDGHVHEAPPSTTSTPSTPRPRKATRRSKAPTPSAAADALPAHPVEIFHELLRNNAKGPGGPLPLRTRGFVVVVREPQSLEGLQQACATSRRGCCTLRYRLQSGATFGTLLRAVLRDLRCIREAAADEPLGVPWPAVSGPTWSRLLQSRLGDVAQAVDEALGKVERGGDAADRVLDTADVDRLFSALADEAVLPVGNRLVLFAEVAGADADAGALAEWEAACGQLFAKLPERVGLVLSGAPAGFALAPDAAHHREFDRVPGVGAADAPAAGPGSTRFQPGELLPDLPTTADHLNRSNYAQSLASFLLHPQTAPPLTIGLYGRWGMGKSSFFQLLKEKLQAEATTREFADLPPWRHVVIALRRRRPEVGLLRDGFRRLAAWKVTDEHRASFRAAAERAVEERGWETYDRLACERIITIDFNAWQYQDAKQTWAGLASRISEQLEHATPVWRRYWTRLRYAWRQHTADVLLNFGLPLVLLVIAAVFVLSRVDDLAPLLAGSRDKPDPLGAMLSLLLPAASTLGLVWAVGWRLVQVVKPVSERVAAYVSRPDYRSDMGYQHRVIEDLKFLLAQLERSRPRCRVLVYIDDLDRCSDEKILEILQATILILADCRLYVMLGMDIKMISRAIEAQYRKLGSAALEPDFAENYLRKIIQIALHLPDTGPEERFALVSSLFSEGARRKFAAPEGEEGRTEAEAGGDAGPAADALPFDLGRVQRLARVEEVTDTAVELKAILELQDYLPGNARELKRFVNTHRFLKILLSASGESWSPRQQRRLVKWLLFCVNWPQLVDDALRAAKDPAGGDCLAPLVLKHPGDERLAGFAGAGEPLSAADLAGSCELAARLSQVIYDDPAAPAETKQEQTAKKPDDKLAVPLEKMVGEEPAAV